jgi:GntR family transcriptional regulator/MocR family aminotransferase
MPKGGAQGVLAPILLDRAGPRSLPRQLADAIREMIESGRLRDGVRLPATRLLARELGVARLVAVTAYEELASAGYLFAVSGAGTFVQRRGSRTRPRAKPPAVRPPEGGRSRTGLSACMRPICRQAFEIDHPSLDALPLKTWSRIASRCCARGMRGILADNDPAGYVPFRRAIADYLLETRGFRCDADRIVVVTGLIQALDLTARVLIAPGDDVCFEEPGRPVLRTVLANAGARVVPVAVDEEGMVVESARGLTNNPRLIVASSSRHHPLGVPLSMLRRRELLDWCRSRDAWLFEDSSEHDLTVTAATLPPLATIDEADRTVFYGAFRSTISPALRLGFLVVPDMLVGRFLTTRILADGCRPPLEQFVLSEFMTSGQYSAHVRRIRRLYLEGQQALVAAMQSHFGADAQRLSADGGVNTAFRIPGSMDALAEHASSAGLVVHSLRGFFAASVTASSGVVLGHAVVEPSQVDGYVSILASLWRRHCAST